MPINQLIAKSGAENYERIRKGFITRPEEAQANRLAALSEETARYGLERQKTADVSKQQEILQGHMGKAAQWVLGGATPQEKEARNQQAYQGLKSLGAPVGEYKPYNEQALQQVVAMFGERGKETETFGEMGQIPGAPKGTIGQLGTTGKYANIQKPTEVKPKDTVGSFEQVPGLPEGTKGQKDETGLYKNIKTPVTINGKKKNINTQEFDDGRVGLYDSNYNFIGYMKGADGKPIRTGVSGRAGDVQTRADIREKGTEKRHKQKETRLSIGQVTDDYRADRGKVLDVSKSITKVEGLLNQPQTPARDLALQKEVSKLFDTSSKAESEVAAWRNFGDLATRISGGISRFTTGEYVPEQINELSQLVSALKNDVVLPSMLEIDNIYTRQATELEIDPSLVIRNSVVPKYKIVDGKLIEAD